MMTIVPVVMAVVSMVMVSAVVMMGRFATAKQPTQPTQPRR